MYQTINKYDFISDFKQVRPNDFSNEALESLFQHYSDLEEDLGEPIEFDPIAICCDWEEYDSIKEAGNAYDHLFDNNKKPTSKQILEELNDRTTLIVLENGHILVQAF